MRPRSLIVALLAGASVPAAAQNVVQSAPVQTTPRIENFSIATPTPTPVPTATPTVQPTPVAPPPVVRTAPTPVATPAPRSSPTPAPTASATPSATPTPTSPPTPSAPPPTPTPLPTSAPVAPDAIPTTAAPEPASGPPWALLIGGALVVLAAGVVFTLRRRRPAPVEPPPLPAAAPPPPRPTPAVPPPPAPPPLAPPTASVVTTLRPQEMWTLGPDAFLKFELVVTNQSAETADAIRVAVALTSAGPELAAEVAGWRAGADFGAAAAPITLRPGKSYVLGGELRLPGDLMHINEVADRAMIVPVVMVALRWRGGLSVRTGGEGFIVGTGEAGAAKLGPIWVDRAGQRFGKLDARRFEPR